MKTNLLNLISVIVSCAIFTFLGRMSAEQIRIGFARPTDYLFFMFALLMFVVTWVVAFRVAHQMQENWSK